MSHETKKSSMRIQRLCSRGLRGIFNGDISATPNHISYICANCTTTARILLQCAEFDSPAQKLFLFGSAASGLTVRLPNMDQMTGGGLK